MDVSFFVLHFFIILPKKERIDDEMIKKKNELTESEMSKNESEDVG